MAKSRKCQMNLEKCIFPVVVFFLGGGELGSFFLRFGDQVCCGAVG